MANYHSKIKIHGDTELQASYGASDDFAITGNAGVRLKDEPPRDCDPGEDGLVSAADRSPLFKVVGESDMYIGTDGDDIGRTGHDQQVSDMLDSGHGYLIRDIGSSPKVVWLTACELCGSAIVPSADDWICELGCQPGTREWDVCRCNWCLLRGQWLRGEYRPKGGRPAKRCGTRECKTIAARERKRRQRDRERARGALARIDEVPAEWREAIREKLLARLR